MKYIYILITSTIVIYLILLTLIYINQRKLLYLPSENNYLDDPINFTYNEFFIEVDKDVKIKSWLIEKDLKKYKTILFLHKIWFYNIVHHRTDDGRAFRTLNILDDHSRKCLAIRVKRKQNSTEVIDALTDLFILRGV